MFSDVIGDMITRIRNVCMTRGKFVYVPHSRMRVAVLEVLVREGYIRSYEVSNLDSVKQQIKIWLRYRDGAPAIKHLRRVSKPSCRVYCGTSNMPKVYNGLGTLVISTSSGIMSDAEARAANVGGEILFEVF